MAWTQTDLDNLIAEIASVGAVHATTFADQSTTFRSLDELLKLKAEMEADIFAASGMSRTRYAATRKGV